MRKCFGFSRPYIDVARRVDQTHFPMRVVNHVNAQMRNANRNHMKIKAAEDIFSCEKFFELSGLSCANIR